MSMFYKPPLVLVCQN